MTGTVRRRCTYRCTMGKAAFEIILGMPSTDGCGLFKYSERKGVSIPGQLVGGQTRSILDEDPAMNDRRVSPHSGTTEAILDE